MLELGNDVTWRWWNFGNPTQETNCGVFPLFLMMANQMVNSLYRCSYGFAAGARKARFKFNHAVDDYLKNRTSLCCVFALLDSGLPPQEIDVEFVAWLTRNAVPFVLVFTKTDKVTPAAAQTNIAAFTARISGWFEKLPAIFTCSTMAEQGREELLGVIAEMMTAIQAESEQTQREVVMVPENLATTGRKAGTSAARKRRPDLSRPW